MNQKGADPSWKISIFVKFYHFWRFLYSFRALSKLSKGARRLLCTFVSSEAPLLHPQPFRSTRGASAPQKNAYKQKAPSLESYIDFSKFWLNFPIFVEFLNFPLFKWGCERRRSLPMDFSSQTYMSDVFERLWETQNKVLEAFSAHESKRRRP